MTTTEKKESPENRLENGKEQETVAIPATVTLKKHSLKQTWKFWYLADRRGRQMDWEDRLNTICTFNTVEDFWALYNNIKTPSNLNMTCDYSVFKLNIPPMWEVPENEKGGRWVIGGDKNRPDVFDVIWLEVLIAMIGEQFGEDSDLICGMVASVRMKGSKIAVWTKDQSDDAANMRIGQVLRKKLLRAELSDKSKSPIFDAIRYEDHDSNQHKNSSVVKAKLTIYAVEPSPPGQ